MKKFFKKLGLMLCTLVVFSSTILISLNAEGVDKKTSNNYGVKGVIAPSSKYFDDVPYYSKNGKPPKTKYFNKPVNKYGYYYNGYLELTQYQSTGDGYLGLYSGYLNRGKKFR